MCVIAGRVHLRLPATSANLGPGLDCLALALKFHLHVDAEPAPSFSIEATGRNADICGAPSGNLLIDTYRELLAAHAAPFVPLRLRMHNEIPLGMGFGSSAAVRLAATALAAHFAKLGWDRSRILAEAARLEGHPDNVAACWLGGFAISAVDQDAVQAITVAPPPQWRAVVAFQNRSLATNLSRAVLPNTYPRGDVVTNLQRVGLLTAAFATGRGDLLRLAMEDRLHQPFRSEVCPLLPRLLPLAGQSGIAGVALSGAGPAILLLTESASAAVEAGKAVARALEGSGPFECAIHELESAGAVFEEASQ